MSQGFRRIQVKTQAEACATFLVYVGLDLGQRRDHSAIAVVERLALGTPYPSVVVRVESVCSGSLVRELLDVRITTGIRLGKLRIGAEGSGQHDDLVIALAGAAAREQVWDRETSGI